MDKTITISEDEAHEHAKKSGEVIPLNPSRPIPKEVIDFILKGESVILVDESDLLDQKKH